MYMIKKVIGQKCQWFVGSDYDFFKALAEEYITFMFNIKLHKTIHKTTQTSLHYVTKQTLRLCWDYTNKKV